jgi:hypothetical protein
LVPHRVFEIRVLNRPERKEVMGGWKQCIMRNLKICTIYHILLGDKIKADVASKCLVGHGIFDVSFESSFSYIKLISFRKLGSFIHSREI